jgi:hypothetical protein
VGDDLGQGLGRVAQSLVNAHQRFDPLDHLVLFAPNLAVGRFLRSVLILRWHLYLQPSQILRPENGRIQDEGYFLRESAHYPTLE